MSLKKITSIMLVFVLNLNLLSTTFGNASKSSLNFFEKLLLNLHEITEQEDSSSYCLTTREITMQIKSTQYLTYQVTKLSQNELSFLNPRYSKIDFSFSATPKIKNSSAKKHDSLEDLFGFKSFSSMPNIKSIPINECGDLVNSFGGTPFVSELNQEKFNLDKKVIQNSPINLQETSNSKNNLVKKVFLTVAIPIFSCMVGCMIGFKHYISVDGLVNIENPIHFV